MSKMNAHVSVMGQRGGRELQHNENKIYWMKIQWSPVFFFLKQ